MSNDRLFWRGLRWAAGSLGLAAGGYGTMVGLAWHRYGHAAHPIGEEKDVLLDRFIPDYEVAERHHVRVTAPAAITLGAAGDTDLQQSRIVRAIFKTRALVLGAGADRAARPKGLLAEVKALGWGVLAETPGREIVMGAVTQPWMANVVFRALPPDAFAAFKEPGYVKIAWTLRADPTGPGASIFRTETRVATTDQTARARFRWYWARFSPGIVLIRRVMLGLLKTEAERRARLRCPPQADRFLVRLKPDAPYDEGEANAVSEARVRPRSRGRWRPGSFQPHA